MNELMCPLHGIPFWVGFFFDIHPQIILLTFQMTCGKVVSIWRKP